MSCAKCCTENIRKIGVTTFVGIGRKTRLYGAQLERRGLEAAQIGEAMCVLTVLVAPFADHI